MSIIIQGDIPTFTYEVLDEVPAESAAAQIRVTSNEMRSLYPILKKAIGNLCVFERDTFSGKSISEGATTMRVRVCLGRYNGGVRIMDIKKLFDQMLESI